MKVSLGDKLYRSNTLKKGLEFVADNGALFASGASLALATVARPIAIYATPKSDKENKKLACAKSIASSAIGFGLMILASLPISRSIKKIDKNPLKYLSEQTVEALKGTEKDLSSSKPYQFSTQLFKLGIGAIMAVPKAVLTCALIPPVMKLVFNKKTSKQNETQEIIKPKPIPQKSLNFTGRVNKEPLTRVISKVIDNKSVQKFALKHSNSNYAMHITAGTDALATGAFVLQTNKSKDIESTRKQTLINNAIISTGLSIAAGYGLDKLLDKPTEKIINGFKSANKDCPKLDKYVEGIRIAKPILILGSVYYCAIPLVSTFFAERFASKKQKS